MAAVAGIERRLAHQAVHAGLGPQPAVRVVALEFHGGALHARHLAGIRVDHLAREATRGAPAQVHAQEHLRPVLRLGTAGAGLDVEEGAVRVHLATKHALELEAAHVAFEPLGILADVACGGLIALPLGELEELGRVGYALGGALDLARRRRSAGRARLPSSCARSGLRPDRRVLELPPYFLEALLLAVVLKETPVSEAVRSPEVFELSLELIDFHNAVPGGFEAVP